MVTVSNLEEVMISLRGSVGNTGEDDRQLHQRVVNPRPRAFLGPEHAGELPALSDTQFERLSAAAFPA